MITKLRRNFILVTMCSMAVVLAVIVGGLNLVSYMNMVDKADSILEILVENDARFPSMQPSNQIKPSQADEALGAKLGETLGERPEEILGAKPDQAFDLRPEEPGHQHDFTRMQEMLPETEYETRYFSVKLSEDGEVISVDTGKIAAVATEDAVVYAKEILESEKTSGFCGSYRYKAVTEQEDILIVFVDRGREMTSFQTLAVASVSMSVLGLLAVFGLVLVFSKMVFRPVAAGYEKQKQFITDASHELKTPLTIISANVEVLEMEQGESNWLNSVKNQVTRLTALVEQMVTLSRMDESTQVQNASDFSLSDAVRETAELFVAPAESKGRKLEITVEEGCTYHGEEKSIRQMVSLLVENAVKYGNENGSIRVSLHGKGRHFQLRVWNTVEEIPQGKLDILFERFYRLDSSRNSRTGGSGIGLSIVKSIVEAHKGRISATSEDGKSLQIVVTL